MLLPLQLKAQSGTEKISVSFDEISLKEAMERIEAASSYTFAYDALIIDTKQTVSLHAQDMEIRLAIRAMLEPTDVAFKFTKSQILLSKKVDLPQEIGAKRTITGVVTDDTGEPIIGGTVTIKGTVNGVTTDIDGKFSIVAREGEMLEFRYIGYKTIERKIKKEKTMTVVLPPTDINLDEVVVVGFQTQKKESVTASINSVKPSALAIPARSLSNALAGQVAGIISVQRSGEPGNDNSSFWIRGVSSYASGTEPLILVDGVERDMNDIDVDEIESFSVLKDAAATAVYGSEGANGVILITTKRGVSQKTEVSFNAQYSMVTPTRMPELMPSYDYLSMWNEASWNDAGNPAWETYNRPFSDDALAKYRSGEDPDFYPNSIWTDLLAKHTSNQRYTINFRGGGEKTKFFLSGAYYAEDGIYKSNPIEKYNANINLKRYNLRANIDMDITPTTKLSVDISGQYKTRGAPNVSSDALFKHMVIFPTHLIPMQWSDGSASVIKTDGDGRYNPYNLLNFSGYSKQWELSAQSKVTIKQELDFITKGLYAQALLSFDAYTNSIKIRAMSPDKYYVTGRNEDGSLSKELKSAGTPLGNFSLSGNPDGNKQIYVEATLGYNRIFAKKHDVTAILVYNQQEKDAMRGYAGYILPYRKQNVVMRGTYTYDERYVVSGSFGATGSESFAANHRWGIFPSASVAWNVHKESFMQRDGLTEIINKLRLRASYVVTGNSKIKQNNEEKRYAFMENIYTSSSGNSLGLNQGTNGGPTNSYGSAYEDQFAAPNLSWETEKKVNAGIDLGLFRNRIDITFDYFTNRRENILIQRATIPTATGFIQNPWQNLGTTTNKGFDASIILQDKWGDFDVSAKGNFTLAKNKVVYRDEVPQAYSWMAATGQAISQPRLYIADGLFTNDDFNISKNANGSYNYQLKPGIATYDPQVRPGDIKYKDLNGDGKITDLDNSYDNGFYPTTPQIVYGFGVNVGYKGFTVGIFFNGTGRVSKNLKNSNAYFMPFNNSVDQTSARMEAADHWTASNPDNQDVLYPRLHTNAWSNNNLNSTWWYRDASFLRLKNLEFGYTFSKKLLSKINVRGLKVFVQGSNVAVWDKIKYWDPEIENSGAKYPICGTWTVGLDLKF
ncbi:MAG: TonB-dependent receptor [Mediterranea sp.]|jgi:TonB-linked SusC/RagA family outer membrane protein|nr:TonB-dependent receptor [Mediterranea sp.]